MPTRLNNSDLFIFKSGWKFSVLDFPASGKGQDSWSIGENSLTVVDGATPLGENWPTDVGDYAFAIAKTICKYADRVELSTPEVWKRTIGELNKEFTPAGYLRTAGVILLRLLGQNLEFSMLGDLFGAARIGNSYLQITSEKLTKLDSMAKEIGGREIFIENRKLSNTTGGYWIFSDDINAVQHLELKTFLLQDCNEILLASDGFLRDRTADAKILLELVNEEGLTSPTFHDSESLLDAPDDVTAIYLSREI